MGYSSVFSPPWRRKYAKHDKNTFVVKFDPETNRKYVTKNIDELTKNHRADDKEKMTAMMPEQPDSPCCPVRSFKQYLSKLHPICNNLCQQRCGEC